MPSPQTPPPMPLHNPRMTGRRIVALWFPHWGAETSRTDYDVAQPFALIDMHKNAQRLVGLNEVAGKAGLYPSMTLPDARALVPDMQTAMADPQDAAARLQKCAYWLQRYTPWIGEDTAVETPDGLTDYGLLLDVSGCAHLFGGERALLADMAARFNNYRDGRTITMRAAIAGSIGAAWGLARFAPSNFTIVPEGQDAEAVLPLPPAALRLNPQHVDLCQRLGLDTIAELARFPRADLTRRFGPAPVLRLEQALGQAGESLNPYLPPPQFMAIKKLPHGVTQIEALTMLIGDLCETLAAQLKAAGQGAQRLDVALTRSDNAVMALSLPLAHPSADAAHMMRLFEERLTRLSGGLDAGFGIEQLQLVAAHTTALVDEQENIGLAHNLGGRLRRSAPMAALGGLYDRLAGRLGANIVVRPVPHASYIPERAVRFISLLDRQKNAVDDSVENSAPPMIDPATRPLFMLCAPEPIEVIAEIPEGAPYRFRWRRVLHEVTTAYGPERIAPEWWDGLVGTQRAGHNSRTRDYYRIEDTQGHRFWLYRDGLYERETGSPRWFMHGVFP
ncbi:MAG: Y-family DNA polymerase [Parvibaculales bacterium]